jgi:hypothetical protein
VGVAKLRDRFLKVDQMSTDDKDKKEEPEKEEPKEQQRMCMLCKTIPASRDSDYCLLHEENMYGFRY